VPLDVLDEGFEGTGLQLADELYARDGTPCASCTCSFMGMKADSGTALGFDAGAGLTLRVCTVGREPLVADDGTEQLWCPDYAPFSQRIPLPADDLERLQQECSRGFLGDLAQGQRPMPRTGKDLRWYDRGFREGWLPPHRIEAEGMGRGRRISGPWEQFAVVGVTPAFGDGHTPAVGQVVLQASDRRDYLLLRDIAGTDVSGAAQPHSWWVSQVSAGAATPLEQPVTAQRGHVALVLRGGEHTLSSHAWRYLPREEVQAELTRIAEDALATARAAVRRKTPVVAKLMVRKGLRARPDHPELLALLGDLD
jgi:hypothetical protein